MTRKNRINSTNIELGEEKSSGAGMSFWVGFAIVAAIAGISLIFNVLLLMMWSNQQSTARQQLPQVTAERDSLKEQLASVKKQDEQQAVQLKNLADVQSQLADAQLETERQRKQLSEVMAPPSSLPLMDQRKMLQRIGKVRLDVKIDSHAQDAGVRAAVIQAAIAQNAGQLQLDQTSPYLMEVSVDRLPAQITFGSTDTPIEAVLVQVKIYEQIRVPGTKESWWAIVRDYSVQQRSTKDTTQTAAIDAVTKIMEVADRELGHGNSSNGS
ncbi:MAG: hypothetical protein WC058_02720 [Phycisphaeraceae bacterium]